MRSAPKASDVETVREAYLNAKRVWESIGGLYDDSGRYRFGKKKLDEALDFSGSAMDALEDWLHEFGKSEG